MSTEVKAIGDVIKQLSKIFKITIPFTIINNTLTKFYDKGLEEMELKFQMNFERNTSRLDLLQNYVAENIKSMNDEMVGKIRKEITQGVVNLESIPKISKRIQSVVDVTKNRAKMIARTETNRALNMAHKDAAIQSGLVVKKEWSAHIDNRTSPICKHLNGKIITMNQKFKYQGQEWDIPPAHVNCFLKGTKITLSNGDKKNIENIKCGDKVLTHKHRPQEVYSVQVNRCVEYYEIDIGTGRRKQTMKVTGKHPVLTQRGWVKVEDLTLNDYMVKIK